MGTKGKILVIEDEKNMREVLKILLEEESYTVTTAANGSEGIALLGRDFYDLVITDIMMPKADGFTVLKKARETSPDTLVIMITAFGTTESGIEAMKQGAYDYIHKPFKIDEIRIVVNKALEKKQLREELSYLRKKIEASFRLENIIGKSPKMQELFGLIPRVAQSNSTVLITGESGSGKELVASALHNLSPRKQKQFVTINCASFPEGLLESELFGHVKGAFTGAVYNKEGLFEIAHEGSIFLDEIAEMSLPLQAKLLRVIENGTFRRVGGTSDVKVDARIIAATNREIREEVASGGFREDLFYRLNVVPVSLPPLRERKEDIPLLVEHFLRKYAKTPKQLAPDAMRLFMAYPWRGNVRELENMIERIVLLSDGDVITAMDLPGEMTAPPERLKGLPDISVDGIELEQLIGSIEKDYLTRALDQAKGVKTEAARLLHLSFRSFRHKLQKHGIK